MAQSARGGYAHSHSTFAIWTANNFCFFPPFLRGRLTRGNNTSHTDCHRIPVSSLPQSILTQPNTDAVVVWGSPRGKRWEALVGRVGSAGLALTYPSPPRQLFTPDSPSYPPSQRSPLAMVHCCFMASFAQVPVLLAGFLPLLRLSMTNSSIVSHSGFWDFSPCLLPPELSNCRCTEHWTLHDQFEGFLNCGVLGYGTRACLQLAQEHSSRHMYLVQQMLFVCWVMMFF